MEESSSSILLHDAQILWGNFFTANIAPTSPNSTFSTSYKPEHDNIATLPK